jgi:hypothetical protein
VTAVEPRPGRWTGHGATPAERLVFAPEGHAWVDGHGRWPGMWEHVEEAGQEREQELVRYPRDDDGTPVVPVPADEPASKADLMALAAEVHHLREDRVTLETALTAMWSALGFYLGRTPTAEEEGR